MQLPQPIKGSGLCLLAIMAGLSIFSCERQPEGELAVSGLYRPVADPGDTLRISGAYFTKNSRVLLGDAELPLIRSTADQLDVLLPGDASSGIVRVREGAKELEAGFLKIMDPGWDRVFPPEAHIYFLHFLPDNKQTGWAFGNDIVFRTLDGGNTWQLFEGSQPYFEKVVATSADHLVGLEAYRLMQSTDGGQSWSDIALPADVTLIDFSFTDERNGYILVSGQGRHEVMITHDGGSSWQTGISIDRYFEGNLFTDMAEEKIWLVDYYMQMLYVADLPAADQWQEHELPRLIPKWSPVFFKNNMALVGGSTNSSWFVSVNDGPLWQNQATLLWKTTNGGASWQKITAPAIDDKPDMEVVDMLGENKIWAVGMDMILRSNDGGNSWQERYIRWLEFDNPWKLYVVEEDNAFILMQHGPLLRYQPPAEQ